MKGGRGKTGYTRKVAIVLAKSGKGNRSPSPATLGWPSSFLLSLFLSLFPLFLSFSQVNSCEISIRHGSMEHINKKSFPACTRVTAHATFSQPLQPISLAFTSRQRGGEVLHRRWVERAAPVEQRMSELHRVVEGGRGMWKRRARGTEIMLRDLWMEGGGETYCLRTKHLPQKPPSHPFHPRVPSALSRSLHRSTLYIYLWYRFTRDLATDDGIPSCRERKKKKRKRRGKGRVIDESGSCVKTRVKIIF